MWCVGGVGVASAEGAVPSYGVSTPWRGKSVFWQVPSMEGVWGKALKTRGDDLGLRGIEYSACAVRDPRESELGLWWG